MALLPLPIDSIEACIHKKFDHMIVCLNRRREQLIVQYKERQAEEQAAAMDRIQTRRELTETKAELQTKMKQNLLHSMLDRMIDEIDSKMKQLKLTEREVELLFECDTQQLEETISHLGQLMEKDSVPTPESKETDPGCGDQWEVDRSTLNIVRQTEAGRLSEMWLGTWNNNMVSIMSQRLGSISREDFLAEAVTLKKLRHKNIVQLCGVCSLEDPLYIVTEYMARGPLLGLLEREGAEMKQTQLINLAYQVASGMAYLELQNCVHINLGARNVLVGDNNQMKVANFRMARFVDEKKGFYQASPRMQFAIRWVSPETVTHTRFSIKSDVWSFGILLMEIITLGRGPYPDLTNHQVMSMILSPQNYRMPKPKNCPDSLYQIMLDCWNANADKRPSFYHLSSQLEDYSFSSSEQT